VRLGRQDEGGRVAGILPAWVGVRPIIPRVYNPKGQHYRSYVVKWLTYGLGWPCDRITAMDTLFRTDQVVETVALTPMEETAGKNGMLWLLGSEVWRYCFRHGIEHLWLEATPQTLGIYQRLGWPLQVVGTAKEYCGEECVLCCVRIRDVAVSMSSRARGSPRL